MKPGRQTSEGELACMWSVIAFVGVGLLFVVPAFDKLYALILLPAVLTLLYFAGVIANNYSENRYRLKQSGKTEDAADTVTRHIGFGRDE